MQQKSPSFSCSHSQKVDLLADGGGHPTPPPPGYNPDDGILMKC